LAPRFGPHDAFALAKPHHPPAGSPEGDRLLLARLRTHIVLSRLMIEHSVELVRQTQEAIATLDRMQRLRQCDE